MKAKRLGFIALLSFGVAHADDPEIFQSKSFNAAMIAQAVNHYVIMGEPAARAELKNLATRADRRDASTYPSPIVFTQLDIASRVSWMCLILWPAKPGAQSRPPRYGALYAIEGHVRPEDFPLYPVAQSGMSYFVLAEDYAIAGHAEPASDYLADCESRGSFRKLPIPVPTRDEARRDASRLRQSPGWVAAWASGSMASEQQAWTFIQNQADSTP